MTPRQSAVLRLCVCLLLGGGLVVRGQDTAPPTDVAASTDTVQGKLEKLGYRYDQASKTYTGRDGKLLSQQRLRRYLAPYDYRGRPLNDEDRTALLLDGYRLEPATGHVLTPGTHKPMTNLDFEFRKIGDDADNRRDSEERLAALVDAQDPAQPLSPVARVQAERLLKDRKMPSQLVSDVASLTALAGDVASDVHNAYLGETRAYDGTLSPPALSVRGRPLGSMTVDSPPNAYFDATEKALGAALQRQTAAHLERNPVGAEVMSHFKDAAGKVNLPAMVILPIDSNAAAVYANGIVAISQTEVISSIVSRAPAAQRKALKAQLADSRALARYLNAHPGAIDGFLDTWDAIIAHELTHAWQHRREPFWAETERENFPDADYVEFEHEAYLVEMRYLHEKLKANPSVLVHDDAYLESYQRFTADLDGWRDQITQEYLETWPQEAATLATGEQLQKERMKAAQELEPNPALQAIEKLKILAFGVGSTQEKTFQAGYDKTFDDFRKNGYPTIQKESLALLAKTFLLKAKAARDSSDRRYDLDKAAAYARTAGDPDLIRQATRALDEAARRNFR